MTSPTTQVVKKCPTDFIFGRVLGEGSFSTVQYSSFWLCNRLITHCFCNFHCFRFTWRKIFKRRRSLQVSCIIGACVWMIIIITVLFFQLKFVKNVTLSEKKNSSMLKEKKKFCCCCRTTQSYRHRFSSNSFVHFTMMIAYVSKKTF